MPPQVFLSYSHDSAEHKDRVLALCDRLPKDGIDAWIDQYETSPPEGWPRWCANRVRAADFVLVVCTESRPAGTRVYSPGFQSWVQRSGAPTPTPAGEGADGGKVLSFSSGSSAHPGGGKPPYALT